MGAARGSSAHVPPGPSRGPRLGSELGFGHGGREDRTALIAAPPGWGRPRKAPPPRASAGVAAQRSGTADTCRPTGEAPRTQPPERTASCTRGPPRARHKHACRARGCSELPAVPASFPALPPLLHPSLSVRPFVAVPPPRVRHHARPPFHVTLCPPARVRVLLHPFVPASLPPTASYLPLHPRAYATERFPPSRPRLRVTPRPPPLVDPPP